MDGVCVYVIVFWCLCEFLFVQHGTFDFMLLFCLIVLKRQPEEKTIVKYF